MDAAGSITIAAKGVARKEEIEELDLLGRRRRTTVVALNPLYRSAQLPI